MQSFHLDTMVALPGHSAWSQCLVTVPGHSAWVGLTCFCVLVCSGNPLLINPSMQPDLSVSQTYTSPMCFQDSMDKELMADHSLLDPLPDIMVKGEVHDAF